MKFKSLWEMAAPASHHLDKMYYHGTSDEEVARKIITDGHIKPPEITKKKGDLVPVAGKTYITPHIHYAQIYSIGSDTAGTSFHRIKGEHGYVFGIHGSHLKDIQPDEDSVGELVANSQVPWLSHLAKNHLHPTTYHKVMQGEYSKWASGGKQLLKKMRDDQKLSLIDQGSHIAHTGELPISKIWRIHKDKVKLLKRDGSNFFDHAEEVKRDEV